MKKSIDVIIRGYKVLHGLIPGYLFSAAVKAVLAAFLPFVNIYMSARIITALSDGWSIERVLLLALVTVSLNLVTQALTKLAGRASSYYAACIWQIWDKPLNEKIQKMDYEHIENPDTRLLRQKIDTFRSTSGGGLAMLYNFFESFIKNVFTVIFSVTIFIPVFYTSGTRADGYWGFINTPLFSVIFFILIIGNTLLNTYLVSERTKKRFKIFQGFHFPNMLGAYYVEKVFGKYQVGKDIKIYRHRDILMPEMAKIFDQESGRVVKDWANNNMKYDSLSDITSNILSAMVYIFVALKTLLGGLPLGSIVQYVGGVTRFNEGLSGLMGNISMLLADVEALELYFEFIDMPDKIYHGTLPVEKCDDNEYEIEFCNVSFKYPGSDMYALRNLSMKLQIGQRMAVVGMNGSGKTTMIKLLCRLYDPTEGEIRLNGVDIKKYDYDEYMNIFSVVFQDFKLFSFTLGQNVAASVEFDSKKAKSCLDMAGLGARLSKMPNGLDTALYKDFEKDGVEISGGEAQKVAMARALYKDAPFIILDEPTAALDPMAEYEVYSKFNEIVSNKTAVYISHRLSSCRFCDDIVVFHEGRLIQRGSHDTLIRDTGGKYYELWNAQAQYYA